MSNPVDSRFRLATWNFSRGNYLQKRDAFRSHTPDLGVIQEANGTAPLPAGDLWHGPNPRSGVAVISSPAVSVSISKQDVRAHWSIVPLEVRGKLSFNALAVWTRPEGGGYVRSLAAALDCYQEFLAQGPSVVLGDFNANAIWDKPKGKLDFSRLANRLDQEFGLVSAYHSYFGEEYGKETRATHYFQWKHDRPFHIDYCFLPKHWVLANVSVDAYDTWSKFSDHRALVVDVAIA